MTRIRMVDAAVPSGLGRRQVVTAKNYVRNPRAANAFGIAGNSGLGAGYGELSYPTSGGPLPSLPTFTRRTVTTTPTGGDMVVGLAGKFASPDGGVAIPLTAEDWGKLFRATLYARSSVDATKVKLAIGWFDAANSYVGGGTSALRAVSAGEWVKLEVLPSAVPTGTVSCSLSVNMDVASMASAAPGTSLDASGYLLHPRMGTLAVSYFDGDSEGASWLGVRDASQSTRAVGII